MFNPRKLYRTGSAKRRSVVLPHQHQHANMSNLITVSSAKEARRPPTTPTKSATLESSKNIRFHSYSHEDNSHSVETKTKRRRHKSKSVQDGPDRPHFGIHNPIQPEIVHHEDLKKLKFQLPHVFDTWTGSQKSATNIRQLFAHLLQNIQEGDVDVPSKNHPIYLYSKKYKKKLLKRLKKSDNKLKDRSVETSSTSLYQIRDKVDDINTIMDDANDLKTSACANSINSELHKSSYASSIDNLFQDTDNPLRNNTPIPEDDAIFAEYFVSLLQEHSAMKEHYRELEIQTITQAAIDPIQGQLDQLDDPLEVPGQIKTFDQITPTQSCTCNDQTIKLDDSSTQISHPIPIPQHNSTQVSLKISTNSTFKLLPINRNIPSESSQDPEKIPEKITPVENMNSTAHYSTKIRPNQPKKRKSKQQRLFRVRGQSRENSAVTTKKRKLDQMNTKSADQLNLRHCTVPTASLSLCRLRDLTTQEILKSSWQPNDGIGSRNNGLQVILEPRIKRDHPQQQQQEQQYDPTQKALVEQCYWVMNCFNMCCQPQFMCPPICCSPCPPQPQQQQQQQCRWSFECTPSNHLTGCGNNDHHNCSNNNGNNNSNNCSNNFNNCSNGQNNANNCSNGHNNANNCSNGHNNANNCSNGHNNANNCSNNGMNNCSINGHPSQSGRSNCMEMNMVCNPRKFPRLTPSDLSPPRFCPRSPSITPPRRPSGGFGNSCSPTPSDTSSSRATYSSNYSNPMPPPRLPPKPVMDRYPAPQSPSYCSSPPMMQQSVPIPVPYPVPCYAPGPPPCFMPQPFFFPFCPPPPQATPPTRSGHGAARSSCCEVNRSTCKGFPSPSGTGFHSGGGTSFPSHSVGGGGMCCPTPIAFCCPFNPSQGPGNVGGLPRENSCEMGKPCKRAKKRAKRRNGKRSSCSCCCNKC